MNTPRDQLTAEIEFWREMVANQQGENDRHAVERMRQALALAEHKLRLLDPGSCPEPIEPTSH